MNETPPIRARIHDSALRRVTRTFAATLGDIFTELFQNARRAGATRVRVAVGGPGDGGGLAVTVSDDGTGIADPAVLLSFGENGWSEDLVRREDAAGMGMLSLARRGCAVSSRPRTARADPAPGWRVALRPEHFLGAAEAPVRADDAAPSPHGTAVTFRTTQGECAEAVRTAAGSAAWHYPLPVVFAHPPHTPPGGEGLERRAFLDGALHAERWRGLVFGVFRDRWNGIGLGEPDLGFHGLTVPVGLPCVETIHGPRWTVAADVEDCPALELVLPARKEAVETAFLEEMRAAARRAIYRAMAAEADPCPAYEDWRRARDAGIDIAPPPAALRPWRPGIADIDHWREPPEHTPLGRDALVMDCEPEPPEAQALCRAAERSGLAGRLFETDPRLEGYPWYDALPRIVGQRTEVTLEGRPCALDAVPGPERTGAPEAPLPPRPETIRIGLVVRPANEAERIVGLAADLAFAGEAWCWLGDARPLVTAHAALEPWALAQLLRAAFFSPSDDADADSWERQRAVFDQEALHLATRLLISDDAARRASIADAVARELFWLIPHERGADITVRDRTIAVTLGEPAGAAR